MQEMLEHHVRERAYQIWLASGCEGEAEQHWLAAERETLAAAATTITAGASTNATSAHGRSARGKSSASPKKARKAA